MTEKSSKVTKALNELDYYGRLEACQKEFEKECRGHGLSVSKIPGQSYIYSEATTEWAWVFYRKGKV